MLILINKQKWDRLIVMQYKTGEHEICINRLSVTTRRTDIQPYWCEITVCDRMTHAGPYQWFLDGDMELWVPKHTPIAVRVLFVAPSLGPKYCATVDDLDEIIFYRSGYKEIEVENIGSNGSRSDG